MPYGFRKSRKVVTAEAWKEVDTKEVLGVDTNEVEDEDMVEVEEYHPLASIVER
jgi:hypothetical protein